MANKNRPLGSIKNLWTRKASKAPKNKVTEQRDTEENPLPLDDRKSRRKDVRFILFAIALSLAVTLTLQILILVVRFVVSGAGNTAGMLSALSQQSEMTREMMESYSSRRRDDLSRINDALGSTDLTETDLSDETTYALLTKKLTDLCEIAEFEYVFIADPKGTVILSTEEEYIGVKVPNEDEEYFTLNMLLCPDYTLYAPIDFSEYSASWQDFFNPGLTFGDLDAAGTRTSFLVNATTDEFIYFEHGGKDLSGEKASDHGLITKSDFQLATGDLSVTGAAAYWGLIRIDGEVFFCYSAEMDMAQFGRVEVYLALTAFRPAEIQALLWVLLLMLLSGLLVGAYGIILKRHGYCKRDTTVRLCLLSAALLAVVGIGSLYFQSLYPLSTVIDNADYCEEQYYAKQNIGTTMLDSAGDYNELSVRREAALLAEAIEENAYILTSGAEAQEHVDSSGRTLTDSNGNPINAYENTPLLMTFASEYTLERVSIVGEQGYTLFSSDENWYEVLGESDIEIRNVLNRKKDSAYVRGLGPDGTNCIRAAAGLYLYTYVDSDGDLCYTTPDAYTDSLLPGYSGPDIRVSRGVLIIQMPEENIITVSEQYRSSYILYVSQNAQNAEMHFYAPGETTRTGIYIAPDSNVSKVYNSFAVIDGTRYFFHTVVSPEREQAVETCVKANEVFSLRRSLTLLAMFGCFIMLLTLVLHFRRKASPNNIGRALVEKGGVHALLRANKYTPYRDRSASGKIFIWIRYGMIFFMFLFMGLMVHVLLKPSSVSALGYIMTGVERGVSQFSLLSCGLVLFSVIAITFLLEEITRIVLHMLKDYRAARVKLTLTLIKALVFVVGTLVILYAMGLDIKGMFTSLGIMTAIIGVGCRDIFSDLMWGISNILSDKYRVGEVIHAGAYSGRVVEVNLRTVKLIDNVGQTKIIGNSNLSTFINESRQHPGAWVEVGVSPSLDLDAIAPLIEQALPAINTGCDKFLKPIKYLGVTRFTPEKVYLGFTALCDDADSEYCKWYMSRKVTEIIKKITDESDKV